MLMKMSSPLYLSAKAEETQDVSNSTIPITIIISKLNSVNFHELQSTRSFTASVTTSVITKVDRKPAQSALTRRGQ